MMKLSSEELEKIEAAANSKGYPTLTVEDTMSHIIRLYGTGENSGLIGRPLTIEDILGPVAREIRELKKI